MASPNSAKLMLFGRRGAVITPGSSDLADIAKTVVMLTAGGITFIPAGNADSDTLEFEDLPAGYLVPYQVRRVTACTGTCASVDD